MNDLDSSLKQMTPNQAQMADKDQEGLSQKRKSFHSRNVHSDHPGVYNVLTNKRAKLPDSTLGFVTQLKNNKENETVKNHKMLLEPIHEKSLKRKYTTTTNNATI